MPAEKAAFLNEEICSRAASLLGLWEARAVYLYAAVRGEACADRRLEFFWEQGISTAFPRVEGKEMAFYYVRSREELLKGAFGIPEPRASCPRAEDGRAPVLVPGTVFSLSGRRLGYGGGYYDRFFMREPLHVKIGLCFEFQIENEWERGPYDVDMDLLVTPERVVDCRKG